MAQHPTQALLLSLSLLAQPHAATPGWKPADPNYRIALPRDHASHPAHRIEWWYYTGNLRDGSGRRFGYQLTFFRVGIDPAPLNPSRWAVRDLFMAHFAVTDVAGRRHYYEDRVGRAGIGWAGADSDSYRVWNDDWLATLDETGNHVLKARATDFSIALTLQPGKPFVAHGADGYSRKGAQQGNASHYYSLTRMPTLGTLTLHGRTFAISGDSWMDHEFGTSFLEPGQIGWDWLSLQLDDGTELMLFQMRRSDGRIDVHSSGTFVGRDGGAVRLSASEFSLQPGASWRSAATGAVYPIGWSVSAPSRSLTLQVTTLVPDQELNTERSTGVTYWEGAIEIRGTIAGCSVVGRGYLEMTGYVGQPMSELLR
jgi:predicted secreted hydrolase